MLSRAFNLKHLLLVLSFFCLPLLALAEEATMIANVNISEAYILEQKDNSYNISFVLENLGQEAQFDVRYGFELLSTKNDRQAVVDSLVIKGESLILKPGDKVTKVAEYPLDGIPAGEYDVMVVARTAGGIRLGMANAGSIYVSQSSSLELQTENCALTVKGDEAIYNLQQGVDIANEEEMTLTCIVFNHGYEEVKFIPQFEAYRRTIFGDRVTLKYEDIAPITIAGGEEKTVDFILPKATDPQAYDVIVSLRDALSRKTISNHLVYHYVLQGPSATIQDMALDKGFYKAGEEIILNLFWTKSADAFTGARGEGTTHEGDLSALVQVVDAEGQTCVENLSQVLTTEHTEIKVTAKQDCLYPLASVQLVTPNGANLDSRDISVPKPAPVEENNLPAPTTNQILIYLTLGALLIATLVVVLLFFKQREQKRTGEDKKKDSVNDVTKTLALLLVIFGSLLIGGKEAEAVTFSASGVNFTVNTNKTTYVAGETISITTTADTGTCSNPADAYSISASVGTSTGSISGTSLAGQDTYGSFNMTAPSVAGSYTINLIGVYGSASSTASINITVTTSGGSTRSATLNVAMCSLPEGGSKCNATLSWNIINSDTPRVCNLTGTTACSGTGTSSGKIISTAANGSASLTIRSNTYSTFGARHGSTDLNSISVIVPPVCPAGSVFVNGGCMLSCPLSSQAGRIIVDFYPAPYLLATTSSGVDLTSTSKIVTNIPAGTYDITAVAWDGYLNRTSPPSGQPGGDYQFNEQYYVKLYNGSTVIGTTASTDDLPYDIDYATFNEKIEDDYVITSDVDYIQAVHSFYPADVNWRSNSVVPVCVAFDGIPLPSATGTITGNGCSIAEGASTCSGSVSWSIQNATSPEVRNLTTDTLISSSANGTNTSITLPYGVSTMSIRSGTSTITTTSLLADCLASTTWNGSTCAPSAPVITPPTLDIDVIKNFVRRGGKTNINFTITSDHDTECTISGVHSTPIVFTHNAATSSAVYAYTTRALSATQKINMTCVASGVDDAVVEGRINVVPSFEEF